jgi:hypothetical protein
MRWNATPWPEYGDVKVVRQFAFIPRRCDDDVVVWLEWVWVQYQFDLPRVNRLGGTLYPFGVTDISDGYSPRSADLDWRKLGTYSSPPEGS